MPEVYFIDDRSILETVRRILSAILALGMAGTLTELILLKHAEDVMQRVSFHGSGAGRQCCCGTVSTVALQVGG